MKLTKKEIAFVDPMHTAKTLVLVYLCFSVPIVLLALFVAFIRDGAIPGFTVLSALILNALLGFALLWIACKVYNWVAGKFGGIELGKQFYQPLAMRIIRLLFWSYIQRQDINFLRVNYSVDRDRNRNSVYRLVQLRTSFVHFIASKRKQ